ncbi:unnamed protein product [marine sediment metagenome]|uniref:Uncharacterized protein n=1 Tax=marine sediment metagenome TaxID=412755 RepID=X1GN19_9ZZZZ
MGMKLGYLFGGKLKGSVDLGTDPYTGLPSTLTVPGGFFPRTVGTIFSWAEASEELAIFY